MGKLIATAQATIDGVVDPIGEWVQADGRACLELMPWRCGNTPG